MIVKAATAIQMFNPNFLSSFPDSRTLTMFKKRENPKDFAVFHYRHLKNMVSITFEMEMEEFAANWRGGATTRGAG